MAKILMAASEATPFSKTGGLADVVGSLPSALRAQGDEVAVAVPLYRSSDAKDALRVGEDLKISLGASSHSVTVKLAFVHGIPFYLIDCPSLYGREGLYGNAQGDYADNHIRYGVFCRAVLAVAQRLFHPQVIHCHDWQTGLVPTYIRSLLADDPDFSSVKTLFTIHNLAYQGIFPKEYLPELGLDSRLFLPSGVEFFGKINLLKGGIQFSDAITTVSDSYAKEIQTPACGFGLEGLLQARSGVLAGIVNGADYSVWNPETDQNIAERYSAADLRGKRACKRDLLREFGLPAQTMDRPLIGIVSRFTEQKGFDLIGEVADHLTREPLSLVALGEGERKYESLLQELASAHPEKIAVQVAFDDRLAHKIEAGADIFLMPSRWEPCGLNQIYSLRYGTVPVVRATGGLNDTVDESTGFKFCEYSGQALLEALRAALAAFGDRAKWREMMVRGMHKDFSWDTSAAEYSALYRWLTG